MALQAVTELPQRRAEALALGVRHYFTGKPCKRGHVDVRHVAGECMACSREKQAKRLKDPEHRQKHMDWSLARYHRKRNEPGFISNIRKNERRRRRNDLAADCAKVALRNATKVHASPPWLTREDKAAIRGFYRQAREMTETTGVAYEVDHIYPLRGRGCCGLHVPWNLQVITASENLRKGNKVPKL